MLPCCVGLNSRLSGSASNLAMAGKSPLTTPRALGLSAGKSGTAGQRNGFVAKSWSDLSLSAINSTPSPRDPGRSLPRNVSSSSKFKTFLQLNYSSLNSYLQCKS